MLKIDQQTKNLGILKYGEPYEFNYKVTNSGKNLIVITKLIRSCSPCTEAKIQSTILNPEETTDLNVVFTPGVLGKTKKEIQIIYKESDKQPENIKVAFNAIIE